MTEVLRVEGLRKSFPARRNFLGRVTQWEHAVCGVDLHVDEGETLALVGESGAGKSTVGRLAVRLEEADAGTISFGGDDVRSFGSRALRTWRRHAQIVFQDPYNSLDPRMTVLASVSEPLAMLLGLGRDEREQIALDLFRRVGLTEHHLDRFPYEFSGGQLQRIAVARAISTNPALIVCDEPVAALDVSIRSQVINLLRDLQQERGMSYLFISHDLSLVRAIGDRVAVMFKGRIVEEGRTREIFRSPEHPYTRSLLSAIPIPDPRRRNLGRRPTGGSAAAPPPVGSDLQQPPGGTAVEATPPEPGAERAHDAGCVFRHRCPEVHEACQHGEPPLLVYGEGRRVACHRVESRNAMSAVQ